MMRGEMSETKNYDAQDIRSQPGNYLVNDLWNYCKAIWING